MNNAINRSIVLDTETTGMNSSGIIYKNHKIIEIGAIELINRKSTGKFFHKYLNPDRKIDKQAFQVHGISDNFLKDKKRFKDIAIYFFNYIKDANLIIHNASFDISFLDYEFSMLRNNFPPIKDICKITDTLSIARKLFPGKKNNLNALCSRLNISIKERILHSAILDAEILKKIYLRMTGKQKSINFNVKDQKNINKKNNLHKKSNYIYNTIVKKANKKDVFQHQEYLKIIKKNNKKCI